MSTRNTDRLRSALKDHLVRTHGKPRPEDFGTFDDPDVRRALAAAAGLAKQQWIDGKSRDAYDTIETAVAEFADDVRTVDPAENETDPRKLAERVRTY